MPAIQSVHAQLFRLPLEEVLFDAKHGSHTHFELVTATIRLDDGTEGTGYTYTGGKGGQSILAMFACEKNPPAIIDSSSTSSFSRRFLSMRSFSHSLSSLFPRIVPSLLGLDLARIFS